MLCVNACYSRSRIALTSHSFAKGESGTHTEKREFTACNIGYVRTHNCLKAGQDASMHDGTTYNGCQQPLSSATFCKTEAATGMHPRKAQRHWSGRKRPAFTVIPVAAHRDMDAKRRQASSCWHLLGLHHPAVKAALLEYHILVPS